MYIPKVGRSMRMNPAHLDVAVEAYPLLAFRVCFSSKPSTFLTCLLEFFYLHLVLT